MDKALLDEAKSHQTVRRAARQNPNTVVVMTGCYAPFTIRCGERLEEAHLVVPNPDKWVSPTPSPRFSRFSAAVRSGACPRAVVVRAGRPRGRPPSAR
jgi:hypothetical protein